eukprot:TRINITY_DN14915_c0_g1_i1.p1 TRINITY_DN14915_c0_g1~~TRINITY_DN14915_c0_g1_i1.p1  ORF type:complete len:643 (-),score=91.24 TRINITY_DN14915_c0_g1_i1:152-2080(-)
MVFTPSGAAWANAPVSAPSWAETTLKTEVIYVPKKSVAKVIGKGGSTIASLGKRTDTTVDARDQTSDPCRVRVTGTAQNIQKVRRMISSLLAQADSYESAVVLDIPSIKIGKVIGPRGAQIQDIQERTGAKLDVEKDFDPCKLSIRGDEKSIQEAKAIVQKLIMEVDDGDSTYMEFPSGLSGAILGTGGSRLKELQTATGARIDLDKSMQNVCIVRINGLPHQVEMAKKLVARASKLPRHAPISSILQEPEAQEECAFGRDCKRPECWHTHPQGRKIDENTNLQVCKYGEKCTRKDCFYKHHQPRIIDATIPIYFELYIDEIETFSHPQMQAGPKHCEVFIDPLPYEVGSDELNECLSHFGKVACVYKIPKQERAYIRFREHSGAAACVQSGIGNWSLGERAKSRSYPISVIDGLNKDIDWSAATALGLENVKLVVSKAPVHFSGKGTMDQINAFREMVAQVLNTMYENINQIVDMNQQDTYAEGTASWSHTPETADASSAADAHDGMEEADCSANWRADAQNDAEAAADSGRAQSSTGEAVWSASSREGWSGQWEEDNSWNAEAEDRGDALPDEAEVENAWKRKRRQLPAPASNPKPSKIPRLPPPSAQAQPASKPRPSTAPALAKQRVLQPTSKAMARRA